MALLSALLVRRLAASRGAAARRRTAASPATRRSRRFIIPKIGSTPCSRPPSARAASARAQHVELPPGESFTVEYVTGKSWSGYNWYQGNYRSLIQVNTDLPIYIDRALDLACHEGYPGPSRLQRAAREAPGARPRLGRVHRLPAVLAAVADRRRHGQLRHRGGVPGRRAHRLRARRAVPAGRHRAVASRRNTTRCWRWSISCRTPATRRRAATSTAQIDASGGRRLAGEVRDDAARRGPSSA